MQWIFLLVINDVDIRTAVQKLAHPFQGHQVRYGYLDRRQLKEGNPSSRDDRLPVLKRLDFSGSHPVYRYRVSIATCIVCIR